MGDGAAQILEPDVAGLHHGRGILIARKLSFDQLQYQGNGNQVLAIVHG